MKMFKNGRAQNERRKEALNRLNAQLNLGTKTEKVSALTKASTGADQVPLTEEDKIRIKAEMKTLEARIVHH